MSKTNTLGIVKAVCKKAEPDVPKYPVDSIQLVAGHGVEGDYHAGEFIRHRYLVRKDPTRKNNRQVLLLDTGILADLGALDIHLEAGMLGENLLLDGLRVMELPVGTRLEIGPALIELTEVRDPCGQLNVSHPGIKQALILPPGSEPPYNAGMLGVVLRGGRVTAGDDVRVL